MLVFSDYSISISPITHLLCPIPPPALSQRVLAFCSPAVSGSLSHPYKLVFSITPNKSLLLFDADSFNNKHLNRELSDHSPSLGRLLWYWGEGWVGPVRPNNDQSPEIAFFVVVGFFFFESHNDFIF